MNHILDFEQAPWLVNWEVTRACDLACRYCRAEPLTARHPDELTLAEGGRLIAEVAGMGTPGIVFSGGDPLQREDLEQLIACARRLELKTGAMLAATHRLTKNRVRALRMAGLDQLAISLDGSSSSRHDRFRQVDGSFARTLIGAAWAKEMGFPLQVNTVLGSWNYDDFDAIEDLVEALDVVIWEVFFLVPCGRGSQLQCCSPGQIEILFEKLHRLSLRAPFLIRVTEAPQFRRYVAERKKRDDLERVEGWPDNHSGGFPNRRTGTSPWPINSGKGYCFVSHVGDVHPCGLLPISAGNVREISLASIYRYAPLFKELRNPARLKGRCGICPYNRICGGSRSRAYALHRDYLSEDPCCAYQPE